MALPSNPFLGTDMDRPLWDPMETGPSLTAVSHAMEVVSKLAPMVSVAGPVRAQMASPDQPWHADPETRTVYWHPYGATGDPSRPRPLTVGNVLCLIAHEAAHLEWSSNYEKPVVIPDSEFDRFHSLVNALEDGRINAGLARTFPGFGPLDASYSDLNRDLHERHCQGYPTFVKVWLSWLLDVNGAKVNWPAWGQDTADALATVRPLMDGAMRLPASREAFPGVIDAAVKVWTALGMPTVPPSAPDAPDAPGDEPGQDGQDDGEPGDGQGQGEGATDGDQDGQDGQGQGESQGESQGQGPGQGQGERQGPGQSQGQGDDPGAVGSTGYVQKRDAPSGDAAGVDNVGHALTPDRYGQTPLDNVKRAQDSNRAGSARAVSMAGLLDDVDDVTDRGPVGKGDTAQIRRSYGVRDLARRFAREVERRLSDNAMLAPSSGHRRGTLDTGRAHRILTGSPRIMRRAGTRGGRRYVVIVCADNSPSIALGNGALPGIAAGALMVCDGLGQVDGIDVGFCAYGRGVHAAAKPGPASPFDRIPADVLLTPRGGTPEAHALAWAVRALSHRRYRNVDGKVILVLTDGEPDSVQDAEAFSALAKSRGIVTIGIGIGSGVTRPTYHRHAIHVQTAPELVIAIPRAIRAALI